VARGLVAMGIILVTILVARQAPVEAAARIFLFMAASNGVAILARFGTDLHIVRRVAVAREGGGLLHYARTVLGLLLVSSMLSLMLWVAYALFIGNDAASTTSYVVLVCVLAMLINVSHSASAWLKGLGKPVWGALFEGSSFYILLFPVLWMSSAITSASFYYQAVIACAVMCVAALWIAIASTKGRTRPATIQSRKRMQNTTLRDMFIECLPLSAIAVLAFLSQWGLLFFADYLGDAALVSELNVLLRLLMPLVFLQTTLDGFLAPKFAAAKTVAELRSLRLKGIMAISIIVLPVLLVFSVFADPLVIQLFGQLYQGLAQHVPLSYVILAISCCLGANGILLVVRDYRVLILCLAGIRAAVVLLLALWLIPTVGMFGGVLAYLLGILVQAILARLFVDRLLVRMANSSS